MNWTLRFILFINILCFVAGILAYLGGILSPAKYPVLLYFTLFSVPLYFANLFFLMLWVFKRKWYWLLSIACLVIGWDTYSSVFQFTRESEGLSTKSSLKVLSYNVGLFGNKSSYRKNKLEIMELLKVEDPDVVCFQEFYSDDRGKDDMIDWLFEDDFFSNGFFKRIHKGSNGQVGMAIFSKYPITAKDHIPLSSKKSLNSCIYTDLEFGNTQIRVINVHLKSNLFSPYDYNYLLKNDSSRTAKQRGVLEVLAKYKKGAITRSKQVMVVDSLLEKTTIPTIVCGDFNDVPSSYAFQKLHSRLADTYQQGGIGISSTFNGPIPFARIDHILCSNDFITNNYKVLKDKNSDHKPVVVELSL